MAVSRRPPVFESNRPLVFAHRGGAKLAPENTMPAIDNGMSLGADGLEIDVQLSADGIPVVIHDQTLDRTTDRTGPVSALTAAELARVDAGFQFSARRRASISRPGHRRAAARRGAGETSRCPHHHRDERRGAGAGAGGGRVDQEGRRGRSHVRRLVPAKLDRYDSRGASGDRHERVGGGGALDAASIVGAMAVGQRAAVCRVPGARDRPAACA